MIARLPGTRNAAPIPCSARPAIERAAPRSRGRTRTDASVKQRDADEKDALAPELIAQRSADENQRAEKQRVGLDHPLDVGDRRVKIGLERGQRDVDDRRIDERHARPEDRGDQRPSIRRGHGRLCPRSSERDRLLLGGDHVQEAGRVIAQPGANHGLR